MSARPGRDLGVVVAASRSPNHGFSKDPQPAITLMEGLGVEGDAHAGRAVQHLYRVRRDPTAPNLAQVHLLHAELLEELAGAGYTIGAGQMGENILTRGLDLLAMPPGTLLLVGDALVEVSGIRDPCKKIDRLGTGLARRLIERGPGETVVRRAGIMGVVRRGGAVRPGDSIVVTLPPEPHRQLEVV